MKKIKNMEKTLFESEELSRIIKEEIVKTEGTDCDEESREDLDEFIALQDEACDAETDDEDCVNDFEDIEYDDDRLKSILKNNAKVLEKDFEKSLAFLDDMVGLDQVKQKLQRLGRYVQLAESAVINHANCIMTTTRCDDFTISESDIRQSIVQPQRESPTRTHIGFV